MTNNLQSADIRKAFIEYFKSKGHTPVKSSSIVPENDPTLLFSNAGMNQFKDCFLGAEKRAYNRAVTSQKCIRISGKHNDLENVGVTARHHTFFEMLGNFSFGDYFKTDAIKFAWEFVTEVLKIPKERLWVTIFENDDEAGELWKQLTDVNPDKILKLGEEENFWSMGDTGPCGPSSEIHYYMGEDVNNQSAEDFLKDDGTYMEIWNLVFMQFDRSAEGTLTPLPKPAIDTGMGLERVSAVVNGKKANYDTDILRAIISKCEELSGYKYDGSSYMERDLKADKDYARDVAMRVIADHSRSVAFLIADGVMPSSDGRGYVLRRLLRRAARHGRVLNFKDVFMPKTVEVVIEKMSADYPELKEHRDIILRVAEAEERKFYETLDSGLLVLNKEIEKLKSGEKLPGAVAFQLHDTYGFPLDLTADVLKAHSANVDIDGFDKAMAEQKARSREDRKSQGLTFVATKIDTDKTKFVGYESLKTEAKLLKVLGQKDNLVSLVFDSTPFYAESGGQVGDNGDIRFENANLKVIDTQKVQDVYFVHTCEIVDGEINDKIVGEKATLEVDAKLRGLISTNHSATHLVHSALRKVLGAHVKQAGSRVDDATLRFDYSHFESVTDDQLSEIQSIVNQEIRANNPVTTTIMNVDEAKKKGAMALFGEKYGDKVRVVEIGPNSLELCGGTHVTRSGDIGFLTIGFENGVSAGVRRIECYAGAGADLELIKNKLELQKIAALLKSDTLGAVDKIEKLLLRTRQLEKEVESAKARLANAESGDLVGEARKSPSGIKVVVKSVPNSDSDTLKNMVDKVRNELGSGLVFLATSQENQGLIVGGATADLASSINVGSIIKEVAAFSGGRGGGRADFAQAGGLDPARLQSALDKAFELVK